MFIKHGCMILWDHCTCSLSMVVWYCGMTDMFIKHGFSLSMVVSIDIVG